jgi:hypothetical protein
MHIIQEGGQACGEGPNAPRRSSEVIYSCLLGKIPNDGVYMVNICLCVCAYD